MSFQNTNLWRHAFDPREDDVYAEARSKISAALLSMREQVEGLVTYIPNDCKDLTVHDITHLDALWVSADMLCGDAWKLNPAEAFVLGAAILTHDAGLTSIAYPDGRAGLKKLQLWDDLVASELQTSDNDQITPDQEASVLFCILRELHAKQAGKMCTQSWDAGNGNTIFLLENSELREAFGECIGRIAHSHHWSINRVAEELSTQFGGSPSLPASWDINEQKLACILRCADAAQVDRTRAPLLLHAAVNPKGFSKAHWQAQSKLNRPTIKGDSVHFASSSVFTTDEADAWWLAYDLALVLNKEISESNALLTEIGLISFVAQRVAGASSSRAFSKFVKTINWHPIDASIRVTDPMALARKLGGKNLYGRSILVPFREMIQNSADAIKARRALERRGQDFGNVDITIEKHPSEEDSCLIHIDDNGLGMSERVLTTTLVDFGTSFWSSDTLRDEFPGLSAAGVKHIGKFGIGFFSVFDFASSVTVVSGRYDLGKKDINALEFQGLVTRPLLRANASIDLPTDRSTRVTLSIKKDDLLLSKRRRRQVRDHFLEETDEKKISLKNSLLTMVSFLDVEVNFSDLRNGDSFCHLPDVYGSKASDFLQELFPDVESRSWKRFDPETMLCPISDEGGDSFGRAALDLETVLGDHEYRHREGHVAVGGIIGGTQGTSLKSANGKSIPHVGVVDGFTTRASRELSEVGVPRKATDAWLEDQLKRTDLGLLKTSEKMKVGTFSYSVLGSKLDLPFIFHQGEIKTAKFLEILVKEKDRIVVPAYFRYDLYLEIQIYDSLTPEFFEIEMLDEIVVFGSGSSRIGGDELAKELKKNGGGPIPMEEFQTRSSGSYILIRLIREKLGRDPEIRLTQSAIFNTRIPTLSDKKWCFVLE